MNFFYDLIQQKFDFIIPLFFMIVGIAIAVIIFLFRFSVYTRRKRYYAKRAQEDTSTPEKENDK